MFYEVLRAQLGSGIAVGDACAAVAVVGVSPQMTAVARAAAAAETEGRGAVEGLADTGWFPPEDVRLLRVAQRSAALHEALGDLKAADEGRLGILATVVRPNGYQLLLLALALFGGSQIGDFMASSLGEERVQGNRSIVVSRAIRDYAPPALAGLGVLAAVVAFGTSQWRGPARRLLAGFDGVHRARVGIAFASLAARLTERGASDVEVLDAAEDAFGRGGFVGAGIAEVRREVAAGAAIENAVPGRLLPREYAAMLKALVPGGERELYPRGYRTVAEVQESVLRGRLTAAQGMVRTFALVGAAGLIGFIVPGIYALAGSLMTELQ